MKINQEIIKKSLVLTLTVCVCAGSFSACGNKTEAPVEEIHVNTETTFSKVLSVFPGDTSFCLNPYLADKPGDIVIGKLMYATLIGNDRTGNPIFSGIEGENHDFEGASYLYRGISDADVTRNGDGSGSLVFTLRSDLFFSDGTPVTADDVVFSIKAAAFDGYDGIFSLKNADITSVKKTDENTVTVCLDNYLLTKLSLFEIPIISSEGYSDVSEVFTTESVPVGAGAYMFDRIIGDNLYLVGNPHFYRGEPLVKTLVLSMYGNENTFYTKEAVPTAEYIGLSSKRTDEPVRKAVISVLEGDEEKAKEALEGYEEKLPITLYTICWEQSEGLFLLRNSAETLSKLGIDLKIEIFSESEDWKTALLEKKYDVFTGGRSETSPYYLFSLFYRDNSFDLDDDIFKLILLKYIFSDSHEKAEESLESLKTALDARCVYYELPYEYQSPIVHIGEVIPDSLPKDMTVFYDWADEAEKIDMKACIHAFLY